MSKKYLFRAKTKEGYLFKVISDILTNTHKNCCLTIDEKSITSKMSDTHTNVLIDIRLQSENFQLMQSRSDLVQT